MHINVQPNDSVVTFTPYQGGDGYASHRASSSAKEPFYAKFISIRVVLVCITIFTVVAMGIGLIILSMQAQQSIVDTLSAEVISQVEDKVIKECDHLFEWADIELQTSKTMFGLRPNFTDVGPGINPFRAYPDIAEYLWGIVRRRPIGIGIEYDFMDGRMIGFESFNYSSDVYWGDASEDPNVLWEVGWAAGLDQSIASVDMSNESIIFEFPLEVYPWLRNNSRDFLTACDSPSVWFDLWLFIGSTANYELISNYGTICNSEGEMMGFLGVSLGLSSVTDMLVTITEKDLTGKIFIMDSEFQLIASSTDTEAFTVYENMTYSRETIYTTNEIWIKDVVRLLNKDYSVGRRSVSINGTAQYLSVVRWNETAGIDWYYVMLLEQNQFLGDSRSYFVKCVVAATLVAAASIGFVLIVTWTLTKPLFILANDLQKMSQLNLDVTDMETPRLFEVGKLYKGVSSMYLALRSFRKFVPIQVITKIIKSEKEATAELVQSKITIVFQDIEGFTGLSERMDPVNLAKLISDYMETMAKIIVKHGGTIDKYIGDCIMSLFGAPEDLPQHPIAATTAAVECVRALAKKNLEWQAKFGIQMQCRVGIHTGDVLVGNIGSDHRMNYTAFGDAVNVASRLEGVNKYFGSRIIVSKAVMRALRPGEFISRKLAKVKVSGRAKPTSIYEIRADGGSVTHELFRTYEEAFKSFKNCEFEKALESIQAALLYDENDKAALKLRARITEAISHHPLPPQWTYVEEMLTK